MTITKLGPTHNFAALSPPPWLAADLTRLAHIAPELRLLVLFADDLPDLDKLGQSNTRPEALQSRSAELTRLCHQHFDYEDPLAEFGDDNLDEQTGGLSPSHKITSQSHINPLTLKVESLNSVQPPASPGGIIILPRRDMQAHEFGSRALGLPDCLMARFNDANIHRGILGHEWNHLALRHRTTAPFTFRQDEKHADEGTFALCLASNDIATANYFRHWRRMDNFLSRITAPQNLMAQPSDYWHGLHFAGIDARPVDEYASQLELKVRSCDLAIQLPHDPRRFVGYAFCKGYYPQLHETLNDQEQKLERLRALLEKHDKPYKYQHSEALASKVIGAAHKLAPGVF